MPRGFSAEELAEMARADAEIEASFCWTNEEIEFGRGLDKAARLESLDAKSQRLSEARRRWYEANKDKVSEVQRRYREANKDKVSEGKRAIRDLRKRLGLSQKDFASQLGVTQAAVSNWERIKEPDDWREIVSKFKELLE